MIYNGNKFSFPLTVYHRDMFFYAFDAEIDQQSHSYHNKIENHQTCDSFKLSRKGNRF